MSLIKETFCKKKKNRGKEERERKGKKNRDERKNNINVPHI